MSSSLCAPNLVSVNITQIILTRWQIFHLKCIKFDVGWGSALDPARWGTLQCSTDPLAGFGEGKGKWRTKGREGKREGKRKGRKRVRGAEGGRENYDPHPLVKILDPPLPVGDMKEMFVCVCVCLLVKKTTKTSPICPPKMGDPISVDVCTTTLGYVKEPCFDSRNSLHTDRRGWNLQLRRLYLLRLRSTPEPAAYQ